MRWRRLLDREVSRAVPGLTILATLLLAAAGPARAGDEAKAAGKVDYDRDIRPLLTDNCYACHGPDAAARKAGLRLDLKSGALGELEDGTIPLVPGKPDESELIFRIEEPDPSVHMPPPKSGKSLKPEQIALIRRWVEQGAHFAEHWAFVPPVKPDLPEVSDPSWPRNEVDRFILARLDKEGLKPNTEADKRTLIRRVTLDLTGLPPTIAEVNAFLADETPEAYENLVDRLLRSPRFGEHMARFWLDAARYGDTHGLHLDNYREIWPWREWVIKAINENMPFDQFIIEQLAGDLLPNPTLDQLVATGFNRNHVSTSEGGSITEEVYVRNVDDQVDTNGTIFLGLTIGCSRCHDHKFDPVTQKDYYSLFAFFNSIDGPALDGNVKDTAPSIRVPSDEQKRTLADLDARIAAQGRKVAEAVAQAAQSYDLAREANEPEYVQREDFVWIEDNVPAGAKMVNQGAPENAWPFAKGPEHPVYQGSAATYQVREEQGQLVYTEANPTLKVGPGDSFFAYVFLDPVNPPKEVMLQWNTGQWLHRAYWGENLIQYGKDGTTERVHMGPLPTTGEWVRLEVPIETVGVKPGMAVNGWAFTQFGGKAHYDHAGLRTWTPQEGQSYDSLAGFIRSIRAGRKVPKEIEAIARLDRSKRDEAQTQRILAYFIENAYGGEGTNIQPLRTELASLQRQKADFEKQLPTTLIFREAPKLKPAYILDRGEYDQRKNEVGRAVPEFLPPMPEGAPLNRLGLAQWLVSDEQPLTARVTVNRFWQRLFGVGLVKTTNDFGTRGDPPSHPDLLDWMAVRFREDGWDVKKFFKRLVLSATYRQGSEITPEKLEKDAENVLLSRGPRFRLDAETIRDQALFVSGLLVERLGGPSVKPPQPSGLWEAVGYTSSNTAKFTADTEPEKVHRRSLYTFWKRTSAPPQMTTLDAPSRESCIVNRERTNTPLQALLLLNEPQMIEAARGLAQEMMKQGGSTPEDRISWAFQRVAARPPEADELTIVHETFRDHLAHYQGHPEAAKQLITIGAEPPDASLPPEELAAWTMVANLLLNLDEVINK